MQQPLRAPNSGTERGLLHLPLPPTPSSTPNPTSHPPLQTQHGTQGHRFAVAAPSRFDKLSTRLNVDDNDVQRRSAELSYVLGPEVRQRFARGSPGVHHPGPEGRPAQCVVFTAVVNLAPVETRLAAALAPWQGRPTSVFSLETQRSCMVRGLT